MGLTLENVLTIAYDLRMTDDAKKTGNYIPKTDHLKPYQFKEGNKANPAGRPKAVINYLREQTDNTKELIDTALKIVRGQKIPGAFGFPSYRDIRETVQWLFEQAWGKAPVLTTDLQDGEYDIHQILLVHLQKQKNLPGTFDIPPDEVIDVEKEEE